MSNGDALDYVVDPKNRRIGKRLNGTFVRGWLYDGQLRIVAELGPGQNVRSRFVYATKSHAPDLMKRSGTTYRYITDPRGSPRLIIDTSTGNVAQKIEYSPYGRVLSTQSPRMQPFGFAGGLWDRDTGLVRFGARDYEASSGSWLAVDDPRSISYMGQIGPQLRNLLRYADNDPRNLIDIDGRAPKNARQKDPKTEPSSRKSGRCPDPKWTNCRKDEEKFTHCEYDCGEEGPDECTVYKNPGDTCPDIISSRHCGKPLPEDR